jgi:Protein of unknown function (DUF4232)
MRRRGWLLGVIALGFISVAACSAHPAPAASVDYVPWLALPESTVFPQAPSPVPTPPVPIPAATPACKAAQLEGALMAQTAATGHVNTPILVRNTGSAACWLEGYADLRILDRTGQELAVVTGAGTGSTFFNDGPAVQVLMPPGTPPLPAPHVEASRGQAFMNIEWYDCRGTHAASLSLDLPNAGGSLKLPFDVQAPFSGGCDSGTMSPVGLSRSPFSPAGYPWPPEPVYLTVDIAIAAPAAAKRGTTLVYFVTVKNTDHVDYLLDPCPNYHELLAGKQAVAGYQLNCATVHHIAPGASVKFEMRLELSGDVATGPNQLTWAMADARLAPTFAHAPIDIT